MTEFAQRFVLLEMKQPRYLGAVVVIRDDRIFVCKVTSHDPERASEMLLNAVNVNDDGEFLEFDTMEAALEHIEEWKAEMMKFGWFDEYHDPKERF